MTTKDAFTEPEWTLLTQVPPMVGFAVATATPHSLLQLSKELRTVMLSFRGSVQVDDELVSAIAAELLSTQRVRDHMEVPEEEAAIAPLSRVLDRLEQVEALLSVKAPESLPAYASLIRDTARATAEAVGERTGNSNTSDEEQAFLDAISLTFA